MPKIKLQAELHWVYRAIIETLPRRPPWIYPQPGYQQSNKCPTERARPQAGRPPGHNMKNM